MKTGGKDKADQYLADEYIQVILYAYAMELKGEKIHKTGVYFIERSGSHVRPPLRLTDKQGYLPLEYTEKRVKYALNTFKTDDKGIPELKTTYDKFFVK